MQYHLLEDTDAGYLPNNMITCVVLTLCQYLNSYYGYYQYRLYCNTPMHQLKWCSLKDLRFD